MFNIIQNLDERVLFFINKNIYNFPLVNKIFILITKLGNAGLIWIIIALILIIKPKTRLFSVTLLIALLMGSIIGNGILKNLLQRPRPFITYEFVKLSILAPKGYSLPSGHSMSSFISATLIYTYNKKYGIYATILACLIAISRVILMVHYLSDVLAGAILGLVLGIIFSNFYKKLYKNNFNF